MYEGNENLKKEGAVSILQQIKGTNWENDKYQKAGSSLAWEMVAYAERCSGVSGRTVAGDSGMLQSLRRWYSGGLLFMHCSVQENRMLVVDVNLPGFQWSSASCLNGRGWDTFASEGSSSCYTHCKRVPGGTGLRAKDPESPWSCPGLSEVLMHVWQFG